MFSKSTRRIAALAACVFALDQFTKWLVLRFTVEGDEIVIIPGFFNLAHRANTGAAWSLFTGNNAILASVALVAVVALFLARDHFHARRLHRPARARPDFRRHHRQPHRPPAARRHAVVDFLHFYLQRRGSYEPLDFPAFNVADSAICTGVALIFLINWKRRNRASTGDQVGK